MSAQPSFAFPVPLSEKYRPRTFAEFIGLEKPKRIMERFASAPRSCAFIFSGPSGTGKTCMALALAEAISAELIHIPSQHGTVGEIEEALRRTMYVPMLGKRFWLILIDEADSISRAAQLALLSKLDATGLRENTIFIFTCNSLDGLEPRFLSRCLPVEFSSYGMSVEIATFLKDVWHREGGNGNCPDLTRLAKDTRNNVRDCLSRLEIELLAS